MSAPTYWNKRWPLAALVAAVLAVIAGVAYTLRAGGSPGVVLAVLGVSLINLLGLRRDRAAWQDVADTYYDRGYRDGRHVARPVVVPLHRCEACPLERSSHGAHPETRSRALPR